MHKRRAPHSASASTSNPEEEKSSLLAVPEASTDALENLLDATRVKCAAPFVAEDAANQQALGEIWDRSFPLETFALPSPLWKNIGFQGTDPGTDIRGAGLIGLHQAQAFFKLMPEGLLEEANADADPTSALPLALASINCSAMLLAHLQLAPKLTIAFLPGGRSACSQETLHRFLSLAWEGEATAGMTSGSEEEMAARVTRLLRCLQALHARLVIFLADLWKKMRRAHPRTNLMDFPKALRATHAHMAKALRSRDSKSLESLVTALGEYDLSDAVLAAVQDDRALDGSSPWLILTGGGVLERTADALGWCLLRPAGALLSVSYDTIALVCCSFCGISERKDKVH